MTPAQLAEQERRRLEAERFKADQAERAVKEHAALVARQQAEAERFKAAQAERTRKEQENVAALRTRATESHAGTTTRMWHAKEKTERDIAALLSMFSSYMENQDATPRNARTTSDRPHR